MHKRIMCKISLTKQSTNIQNVLQALWRNIKESVPRYQYSPQPSLCIAYSGNAEAVGAYEWSIRIQWGTIHWIFKKGKKKKNKTSEMDRTMMWKVCSQQKLMAKYRPATRFQGSELLKDYKDKITLGIEEYTIILKHLQRENATL